MDHSRFVGAGKRGSLDSVRTTYRAHVEPSHKLQHYLSKRSAGFRLRWFARIVMHTQGPTFKLITFLLISITLVVPLGVFLFHTATPESEPISEVGVDVTLSIGLGMTLLYGPRNLVLLLLGLGALNDAPIMCALALDVMFWIGLVTVQILALCVDEWTDDDMYMQTTVGFLAAVQLNTYMFLNVFLDPLVKLSCWKGGKEAGITYCTSKDTVPTEKMETIIDDSSICERYKRELKEELADADYNHKGKLDRAKFFDFSIKVRSKVEEWDTEKGKPDENLRVLGKQLGQLEFSRPQEPEEESQDEGLTAAASRSDKH
jgi:hypothetical protein